MTASEKIAAHKLPCGPVTVSVNGTCRRRLADHFDALLDRLTKETRPEGRDPEQDHDIEDPSDTESEETRDEKKKRLIEDGKLKVEVAKEVAKYRQKVMPKPKTSDHSESDDEVDDEQGNSKLLQRIDGKMTRWQGKG